MLRDKIQRLGNVNLDAIGEQDELEKRQKFLADAGRGPDQLQEAARGADRGDQQGESSERFEQTFNAVREHFQGMFRKLFGGGKADIFLETELMDQTPQIGPDGQPLPLARRSTSSRPASRSSPARRASSRSPSASSPAARRP